MKLQIQREEAPCQRDGNDENTNKVNKTPKQKWLPYWEVREFLNHLDDSKIRRLGQVEVHIGDDIIV